jgi:ABC-2 type transport system permease protein
VMTMTSEYTSGMIRATLAAVPRRPLVLAAKAAVFGMLALAAGEAASFISFAAGGAALRHGITAPSLAQPGVLRAVLLAGASFSLIGLLGLGLGAIVRHTAAAIAVLVGGVYLAAQFVGAVARGAAGYMPVLIIGNSLTTTKPETRPPHAGVCPHFLPAWAGLGVLCLYAAVVLGIGAWLLARRDA